MSPFLYPPPPPSSPTVESITNSSFFSTVPPSSGRDCTFTGSLPDSPVAYPAMRRNSLGLDLSLCDDRMQEEPSFSSPTSPPLIPLSWAPGPSTSTSSSQSFCPVSPPLVALSLPVFPSNLPSTLASSSHSPTRPSRPVPHPLHSTSKLRLEMTPLPTFQLPLVDIEMSPPWNEADLAGPPPPTKQRKNSLVSLPVAPPSPPLTPNDELPSFRWGEEATFERGRSTEVTPITKRRRYN